MKTIISRSVFIVFWLVLVAGIQVSWAQEEGGLRPVGNTNQSTHNAYTVSREDGYVLKDYQRLDVDEQDETQKQYEDREEDEENQDAQVAKKDEEAESVLFFNFLYHLIEKYKFSEVTDQ